MDAEEKKACSRQRKELLAYLRKLVRWRSNDGVKLAFLESEDLREIDSLDLSGVTEVKRSANGAFEVRFVDKVKVLNLLRELTEEGSGGGLEALIEELKAPEDGDVR